MTAEPAAADGSWPGSEGAEGTAPLMLSKDHYYDPAVFARELERLFGTWQFAGMTSELADNNAFVTLDLPGAAVVVQNFKGELKAFQNVCTHRFNRLQTEGRGKRPLICGYHAWRYDGSGFPVGRGDKAHFPAETEDARASLCLPSYPVETCGRFVFVDLSGRAGPLADYLGTVGDLLKEISGHLGAEIQFGMVPHGANWKLLVENVLECYHCAAVHSETFINGLGVGRQPIERVDFAGAHSSCHFPRTEIKRENLRRMALSHLDGRGYRHDSFFHVHVFPNLFISSQEGLTFYVGHAMPIGPRETVLKTRIYEPVVELKPSQRARQDMLNAQSLELAGRVLNEDKAILENVQRGVELSDRPGTIGGEELRIAAFFDRYRAAMA